MSLIVTAEILKNTKSEKLRTNRDFAKNQNNDREYDIDVSRLGDVELKDINAAATLVNDTKTIKAIASIVLAQSGVFSTPVPNFKAFKGILELFLKSNLIDGWIYVAGNDSKLYPQLVTHIGFDDGISSSRGKAHPSVYIKSISYGCSRDGNDKIKFSSQHHKHSFEPQEVARRRVVDILFARGIHKESIDLKSDYTTSLARHHEVTMNGFAQQFRVNGAAYAYEENNYNRRGIELINRKVIHDLDSSNYGAIASHVESALFNSNSMTDDNDGVGEIPEQPVVRVFDIKQHEFFWVHSDNMVPYVYDKSLREKLILPQTHRDLLDVLTSDLDAFVSDIIEGKSAGNVILCKGIAGVGKTLTAEVYAELIERPLYSISTGNLGTKASEINKNLQLIFSQAKRWGCVLLLDEADVFVIRRGDNIEQNAIVAEFLRTIEYFDGLLFMTTNRPNDIDEAIISRCAAIINYEAPGQHDATEIWKVMANQYETQLDVPLIDDLVKTFPAIAPRDIKMLFRLALRIANSRSEPLTIDIFRQCAMFRAIDIQI